MFVAAWGVHSRDRARAPAGHVGLALWSFMMSTAHGAGLMLALTAVAIHTAAMLAVASAIATGVCRGFDAVADLLRSFGPRH